MRLGVPVCTPFRCVSRQVVDQEEIHGLSCRESTDRIFRRNAATDQIQRLLLSTTIPPRLEPVKQLLLPKERKRPGEPTTVPCSIKVDVLHGISPSLILWHLHRRLNTSTACPGQVSIEAKQHRIDRHSSQFHLVSCVYWSAECLWR
jgi:hypothetical protein